MLGHHRSRLVLVRYSSAGTHLSFWVQAGWSDCLWSSSLKLGVFFIELIKTARLQAFIHMNHHENKPRLDSFANSLTTCRNHFAIAGTSPGVPGDILGAYEELRWMEPHMSSPSPIKCLNSVRDWNWVSSWRTGWFTHTDWHRRA